MATRCRFGMADSPSLGFVTHDFGSMSERVQAILAGTFKQRVVSASDRADEKPTSDYQDLMKSTYVD